MAALNGYNITKGTCTNKGLMSCSWNVVQTTWPHSKMNALAFTKNSGFRQMTWNPKITQCMSAEG